MESRWKNVSLKDSGVILIDCVHKTPKAQEEGKCYIGIPQLKDGRIDFNANPRLITEEDLDKWTIKAKPQTDDVILSRRCNPGETAYVSSKTDFALGQNLVLLRADGEHMFPPYLRWITRSPQWWWEVNKYLNVGAVFDSLRCAEIPSFEIPLPPLAEQKRIAHILGSLDDKIELNRKMNATLEAMAQALFKSWFVDFDPVIDNALLAGNPIPEPLLQRAETRKEVLSAELGVLKEEIGKDPTLLEKNSTLNIHNSKFPSSFTESEALGWIPEGWEVKQAKDFSLKVQNGGTPNRNENSFWEGGTVPWLSSGEVRKSIIIETAQYITTKGFESSSAKWNPQWTTVVALYGATAGQTSLLWKRLTTNQAVCALIPKENCRFYNYLNFRNRTSELEGKAVGSAQQNLSKGLVESVSQIDPGTQILAGFDSIIQPIFEKRISNLLQNQSLSNLQDTLLPKLISGSLQIS